MRISTKVALLAVPVLLAEAGVTAWYMGPGSSTDPASAVPVGYVELWSGDQGGAGMRLNPPPPGKGCTVAGVNNSGTPLESVRFWFSTEAELSFADDPLRAGGFHKGEFHSTKLLMPGFLVQ